MANDMPSSDDYTGLARKVLEYSESFLRIVNKIKQPGFRESDWAPLEELVDVENFRRVFLTDRAEISDWPQYQQLIAQYGGMTAWGGTLRRITEVPRLVFLQAAQARRVCGAYRQARVARSAQRRNARLSDWTTPYKAA